MIRALLWGTSTALLFKCLGVLAQFVLAVYIGRTFGVTGAGIFFLALTVANVGNAIGRVGTDNPVVRYTSGFLARDAWPELRGFYRAVNLLVLSVSCAVALLLYVGAPFFARSVFHAPELQPLLRGFSLFMPANALFMAHAQFLKGAKRIVASQVVESVSLPAFVLGAIWAFKAIDTVAELTVLYAVVAWCVAALAVGLWHTGANGAGERVAFARVKLMASSLPLLVAVVASMVMTWGTTLYLGVVADTSAVGLFSVAMRASLLMSFFILALNNYVGPQLSEAFTRSDRPAMGVLLRHSSVLLGLAVFPVFLLFMLVPEWVMGLFGDEFTSGANLLRVLAVGQFVNVVTGPVGLALLMAGEERLYRNIVVVSAVSHCVLGLLLVNFFSGMGAAWTVALTLAGMNLVFVYFVWRRLGIPLIGASYGSK